MSQLRVLLVTSSARIGGAERHVAALASGLARRGHEVRVLCTPGGWLGDALRAEDITVVESPMQGRGGWRTLRLLWQLLRTSETSVVHSHLTGAAYYASFIALMRRVPMIASVHNVTGAAYRSTSAGQRPKRRFALPKNADWIFHFVARHGGTLVAVSDFVRDLLLQDGIPEERIRVIYNGTEFADSEVPPPDGSVRGELGIPQESLLVGTVGRVRPEKGQLLAVEAFGGLPPELRDRARLVFIGAVDPSFAPVIRDAIKSHHLEDRVIMTGVREDVGRLLSAVDIVLHPSGAEACPLAVLEAMALGKPVVATRVGGLVNVISQGDDGFLVESDAAALASALERLLNDPEERRRMGLAARQTAAERFSLSRMISNYEELYASQQYASVGR